MNTSRNGARSFVLAALTVLAVLAMPVVANAQASLVTGLGGAAGFGTNVMATNDDGSTTAIDLRPFDLNGLCFFGSSHTTLFINNNGNVTFNAAVPTFTPDPFPVAAQPMIAPYWGDVDTRGTGTGIPPENRVYWDIRNVGGLGQLVVTWYRVGYYNSHVDKRDTFQLVIRETTASSGTTPADYDVEFRYNALAWTTGDASGGSLGLGGTPAQAGFDAGDGVHYSQLPGSRTASVLNLQTTSNVTPADPGVWRFRFHSCQIACNTNADCAGTTPICDTTNHVCRPCTMNSDCSGSTPVCATAGANMGRCVQCNAPTDCSTGMCSNNACVCLTNANCGGSTPICDLVARTCRSCDPAVATDCVGGTPVCGPAGRCVQCGPGLTMACTAPNLACSAAGSCVECAPGMTTACTGTRPICNTATNTCRGCTTATQATDCPTAAAPLCQTAGAAAGTCVAPNSTLVMPANGSTTTNMTPPITGTAPPGSTVIVYVDGMEIGRTTATATGTFSFTPPMALSVGNHTAYVAVAVGAGQGPNSNMSTFLVAQCVTDANCSGATPFCDTTAHLCRGCLTNANCSGSAPACDSTSHACRACNVATQATDCSSPTAPVCVSIGPMAGGCAAAVATVIQPATGSMTVSRRPTVTGTAPPGSTVVIYIDGVEVGRTTADAAGNYSFTPTMDASVGAHTASAAVAVGAGTGAMSAPNAFVIVQCLTGSDCGASTPVCDSTTHTCRVCSAATQATDCPTMAAPLCQTAGAGAGTCVAATSTLVTPADGSTTTNMTPTITGTAPPGSTVIIYIDGMEVGRTTADASGMFSFTPTMSLAVGSHMAAVAVAVGAGQGPSSNTSTFTVAQCVANSDCTGSTPLCDTAAHLCRNCLTNADCSGSAPVCDTGSHACRACDVTMEATDCPASAPVCVAVGPMAGGCVAAVATVIDPATGSSTANRRPTVTGTAPPGSTVVIYIDGVEVGRTTADAGGAFSFTPTMDVSVGSHTATAAVAVGPGTGAMSSGNTFTIVECMASSDCASPTPVCDTTANVCRACLTNTDCTVSTAPICDTTTFACRACGADTECSGATPACSTTSGACVACTDTNQTACTGATPACDVTANLCVLCTPGASGNATACASSDDGHACEQPSTSSPAFCGCSTDTDCGDATSGRICEPTTSRCTAGCFPGGARNGCPAGQFCSSNDPTVAGLCTTTCNFDTDCTTLPDSPHCLVGSDGGVSQCVQCVDDAQCAGRTDLRNQCIGANHTCAQCSPTNSGMCTASGVGSACLGTGLCGCTSDSDCSTDRMCNASTNQCEMRPMMMGDGGTDGSVDASVDASGDANGSDSGRTDAGHDASAMDAGADAGANVTGGGACSCRVPGAPSHGSSRTSLVALFAGLAVVVASRRRGRAA